MITPDYLQKITEQSEEYAGKLRSSIVKKMISRMMARIGRGENYLFTASDRWQTEVLQDAGVLLEEIQQDIVQFTKLQHKEVEAVIKEASIKALEYDHSIYKDAGLSPSSLNQSPLLIRIMEHNYRATNGEVSNFTRTMANESQKLYVRECDNAYRAVTSGAVSYSEAVKDAIENVIKGGGTVHYPSKHKDTLETAVSRAVRTGVNQSTAGIQMARMEEMNWDIVGTSAHLGARTGDGGNNHTNHYSWQAGWFSRKGQNSKFPPFIETTGYGLVDGLCGANCRHGFFAGDGKHHPYSNFDTEENKRMEDLQKKQRKMERGVRKIKKELIGLREALNDCRDSELKFQLQTQYDKQSLVLRMRNEAYRDYCKKNDLRTLSERLRVPRWNREQAANANGAATRRKHVLRRPQVSK